MVSSIVHDVALYRGGNKPEGTTISGMEKPPPALVEVLGGETVAKGGTEVNEWISVKERLPEAREDVLVVAFWHEAWQTLMGWYATGSEIWHVDVGLGDKTDLSVTYWMPLPEPPKEETT